MVQKSGKPGEVGSLSHFFKGCIHPTGGFLAGFQPSMGPLLKDQLKELVTASQASVLNVRIKGSWIQKANPNFQIGKPWKIQVANENQSGCIMLHYEKTKNTSICFAYVFNSDVSNVCLFGRIWIRKNYRQSESSQFAGSGWVVGSNFHGHNATQKYAVIQVFVVKFGRSKFPQRFSVETIETTAVLRMKFPAVGGDHGSNKFFSLAAMPAEAEIYRRHWISH